MLKDKTHRPTTPSGIFPRIFYLSRCACVIGSWERMDSRGCSRTASFVFEQSGAPFPTRGLTVLVTRCPELSAILNCAWHGRFPFDQIFRFEIPGIPCDKWNSIFRFVVGLTNPRSSNGGLFYLCLLALGLLDNLK